MMMVVAVMELRLHLQLTLRNMARFVKHRIVNFRWKKAFHPHRMGSKWTNAIPTQGCGAAHFSRRRVPIKSSGAGRRESRDSGGAHASAGHNRELGKEDRALSSVSNQARPARRGSGFAGDLSANSRWNRRASRRTKVSSLASSSRPGCVRSELHLRYGHRRYFFLWRATFGPRSGFDAGQHAAENDVQHRYKDQVQQG